LISKASFNGIRIHVIKVAKFFVDAQEQH